MILAQQTEVLCALQGVFLTFAKLSNGQNSLTRIRFNRQHFDKAAASVWWQNNKAEMGLRYNIASNSGTPTGLHTPDSEPAVAGVSSPHHRSVLSHCLTRRNPLQPTVTHCTGGRVYPKIAVL